MSRHNNSLFALFINISLTLTLIALNYVRSFTSAPIYSFGVLSQKQSPVFLHYRSRHHYRVNANNSRRCHGATRISASSTGGDELTSALAKLDQQWQTQQRQSGGKSRWTKLVLKKDNDQQDEEQQVVPSSETSVIGMPPLSLDELQRQDEDFVYLLQPPYRSIPSCIVVFTGGAGLGTYPQIAYNELLLRISNRLNAAVITAPYSVGLDHFSLAKQCGDKCRRAIIQCQDDTTELMTMYPPNLPVYSLSHSLGAKLSCIYVAATDASYIDGIGLISYNNFGFGQTVGMAREFAKVIRGSSVSSSGVGNSQGQATASVTDELWNGIFNFAETAISAIGIEFSPKPADMDRILEMKFSSTERKMKTRLFSFDEDKLDNTQQFVSVTSTTDNGGGGNGNGKTVSVSGLLGTHLTPVYFKFGLDEIFDSTTAGDYGTPNGIPEEAKVMAKEAMGGFESASFGNEVELNMLVDEICTWIKGGAPTRKPSWLREKPLLSSTSTSGTGSSNKDNIT